MNPTIDRSELAIWAQGTEYTTDDLVRMYADYCGACQERGGVPCAEGRWANEVLGLPNLETPAAQV